MSIKVMTSVWRNSKARRNGLLVMLALADNADDDGVCWPSQRTIARKARLSHQGVAKLLDRLVAIGELDITRRPKTSNRYRILLPLTRDDAFDGDDDDDAW